MTDKTELVSADLQAIAAAGQAVIRCGCGFTAMGSDEGEIRDAFDVHPCPSRPVAAGPTLLDHVFSFWGWVIISAIAFAIVAAVKR